MRQQDFYVIVLISFLLALSGCGSQLSSTSEIRRNADHIARKAGLRPAFIKTTSFTFTTYARIPKSLSTTVERSRDGSRVSPRAGSLPTDQSLVIYIEGDGRSFINRNTVSPDPTPQNPLALKLAASDPRPNVVYLARPCQYTPIDQEPYCRPAVWTSHRFSETVISAMNEAVEQLKQKSGAKKIQLIGFSGGAAIAVLIAARRHDVINLTTVAGDLDHESMTAYHNTTPLQEALNPRQFAHTIAHIPQQHYVGAEDTVVPVFIAERFLQKIAETDTHSLSREAVYPKHVKLIVLPKVSHHQGWVKCWPQLISSPSYSTPEPAPYCPVVP